MAGVLLAGWLMGIAGKVLPRSNPSGAGSAVACHARVKVVNYNNEPSQGFQKPALADVDGPVGSSSPCYPMLIMMNPYFFMPLD